VRIPLYHVTSYILRAIHESYGYSKAAALEEAFVSPALLLKAWNLADIQLSPRMKTQLLVTAVVLLLISSVDGFLAPGPGSGER
jgi:hypothetical protein